MAERPPEVPAPAPTRADEADDTHRSSHLAGLMARVAEGDRGAFAELYDQTSPRVYGLILRVLRDPGYAEETAQEVYLSVWQSADRYSAEAGSVISWLLTIAHRRAVDRVRSEEAAGRRTFERGVAALVVDVDDTAERLERDDETAQVRNCLGTLTDVQRQSVELAYYGGLTYPQVAQQLGAALPTVKSRIRDGLRRLRTCLEVGRDG
ncbi:sigma-70 family RNA polymerase sigma factor SigK [Gordonia jinhuaensis]|uniref:ECF RNA polymerase sigma factor SigK n=2 Tax=Gordonia jinhuaensis TaxID=1517702 RepID=A0A916WUK1_9ACTN|nr:ECF RNA polymerase sigma factor SigK [Gordonia jinhuaensis]GGB35323.1 ECF RNA polymerase sigma factor SigK [Gordonia jinhuaensis]